MSIKPLSQNFSSYSGQQKSFTTLNFGEIIPLTFKSAIAKDSWRLNPHTTVKMSPLAVPTHANIRYNQAAFKVNYHLLDDAFDDLIAGKTRSNKQRNQKATLEHGLWFSMSQLWNALFCTTNTCDSRSYAVPEDEEIVQGGIFATIQVNSDGSSPFGIWRPRLHVLGFTSSLWDDDGLVDFCCCESQLGGYTRTAIESDGIAVHTDAEILQLAQGHDVHLVVRMCRESSGTITPFSGMYMHAFVNFNRRHGTMWHKILESTGLQMRCVEILNPLYYHKSGLALSNIHTCTEANYQDHITTVGSGGWKFVDDSTGTAKSTRGFEIWTPRVCSFYNGPAGPHLNFSYVNTPADLMNHYTDDMKISAYRLLAFLKVYNDYFNRASFAECSELARMLDAIKVRSDEFVSTSSSLEGMVYIHNILAIALYSVILYYENDVVTTIVRKPYSTYAPSLRWGMTGNYSTENPQNGVGTFPLPGGVNGPGLSQDGWSVNNIGGAISPAGDVDDEMTALHEGGKVNVHFQGDSNENNVLMTQQLGAPMDGDVAPYYQKLLASGLRYLQTMNFVGSRTIDRLRAIFGVSCDYQRLQRCECLGIKSDNIQVDQVDATADTYQDGELVTSVGDYVANGFIKQTSSWKAKFDCMGEIVVLNWMTLKPIYTQQVDPNLFHVNREDFFDPALDGLGYYVPASQSEINVPRNQPYAKHKVAGWRPIFDEYRYVCRDVVTGDFKRFQGMDAWLGARQLDSTDTHINDYHGEDIRLLSYRRNHDEYDSLFVDGSNVDKFLVMSEIEVLANRPVADPMQALGLSTGAMDVSQGGNSIH